MIRSVTRTAGSRRVFSRSILGESSAGSPAAAGRQRVAPIASLHQTNPWNESGKFHIGIASVDRRFFSATPSRSDESDVGGSAPSVDETLDKLFAENGQGASDALQAAADVWSPTWYNIADQAVVVVHNFHDFTGLEYGWAIVGVTLIMRLGLFPLMIHSQRTSSRMAHLQPELNQIRSRYEALGTPSRQDQMQFGTKIKALFKRFEVKPMQAFIAPAAQLPLFMGMFFGLKKMPGIYPEEFAVGGILWFPDLTLSDPYYALPILSSLTFLAMIELGKDQMTASNPAQGQMMLNLFRVMSVGMIPFLMSFDSAMLCYWTANNTLTLAQTALLQQKPVRDGLGIWDKPKPVPGQETPSLTSMMKKIVAQGRGEATSEAQEIQQHNQAVETKKRAAAMMRSAREKRRGITESNTK